MAPRKPSGSVPDHGDWAVPYQPADIADLDPATADRRGGIPKPPMLDAVYRVVETEGPIHRQVLLRHLGELLHKTRPSSISPSVNAAADQLRDEGRIAEAGDFLDVAGRPCTEARWPLPGLSAAGRARSTGRTATSPARPRRGPSAGLGAEEAVGEALAFFGWTARNAAARARLMADLYRLRDTGALTGWPDKLEPAG